MSIDEAFGDHVNFDLIPTVAINETNIASGNPVFGLDAPGSAMIMEMKNGFNYQGYEVDGRGRSYSRRLVTPRRRGGNADVVAALLPQRLHAAADGEQRDAFRQSARRLSGDQHGAAQWQCLVP